MFVHLSPQWFNNLLICLLVVPTALATRQRFECKAQPYVVSLITSEIPVSITNSSDHSLSQDLTCESQCTLHLPRVSAISWVPEDQIVYTTEIIMGIVSIIVYMDATAKATAVRTHLDYQGPRDSESMYPPRLTVDEYGSSFAVTALGSAGTTTYLHLAYPTTFIEYTPEYSWEGVMPTSAEAGVKSCAIATAAPSTRFLSGHPLYSQPTVVGTIESTLKDGSALSVKRSIPLWVSLAATPDQGFFRSAFPSEEPIHDCTPIVTASPAPTIFSVPRLFWNYTTVIVWDGPTANHSRLPARTGSVFYPDGLQGAPYQNSTLLGFGSPTILTIRIDGDGTTTLYGDGPHQQTETRLPITHDEERPQVAHNMSSWKMPGLTAKTDTGERNGAFSKPALHSRSAWPKITNLPPAKLNSLDSSESSLSFATGNLGIMRSKAISAVPTDVLRVVPIYILTPDVTPPARTVGIAPPQHSMPGWDAQKTEGNGAWVALPSHSPGFNVNWDVRWQSAAKGTPDAVPTTGEARGFRPPDADEASLIDGFFSQLAAPFPQPTRSPNRVGQKLSPVDPDIIANYVKEDSGLSAGPLSGGSLRLSPLPSSRKSLSVDNGAVYVAANVRPDPTATLVPQLIFTNLPTTVKGKSTTIPAYIIPRAFTVLGVQEVTLNGRPTTLSMPNLLPTYLPTTISGVPTSVLAYIISGQSIATVGQTITLDGTPTVLKVPDAVFVQIQTTINGVATMTPVYIISGSSTASIGQSVTLNGIPTMLAAPDLVPTLIPTMIEGIAESRFAYVLRTSSIATLGETVTLDGKTTVLSEPTGPLVVHGGAAEGCGMPRSASLIGLGAIFVALL